MKERGERADSLRLIEQRSSNSADRIRKTATSMSCLLLHGDAEIRRLACLRAAEAPDARIICAAALGNGPASWNSRLWNRQRHPAHLESLHVDNLLSLHLDTIETQLFRKWDIGLHGNDDRNGHHCRSIVLWDHLRLGTSKAINAGLFRILLGQQASRL